VTGLAFYFFIESADVAVAAVEGAVNIAEFNARALGVVEVVRRPLAVAGAALAADLLVEPVFVAGVAGEFRVVFLKRESGLGVVETAALNLFVFMAFVAGRSRVALEAGVRVVVCFCHRLALLLSGYAFDVVAGRATCSGVAGVAVQTVEFHVRVMEEGYFSVAVFGN